MVTSPIKISLACFLTKLSSTPDQVDSRTSMDHSDNSVLQIQILTFLVANIMDA